MEINQVQHGEKLNVPISVRTSETRSKFMKDNSISPSKTFNRAVDELIDQKIAEEIAANANKDKASKLKVTAKALRKKTYKK